MTTVPGAAPQPHTLDFIWDMTKGAVEVQLQTVDTLDSKAFQSIGVASVIIGLIALGSQSLREGPELARWFIVAALVAYTCVGIGAFVALGIRRYRRSLQADHLWPLQWQQSEAAIKHALVADTAEAYKHNKTALRQKARAVRVALAGLVVETAMVGTAVIISVSEAAP